MLIKALVHGLVQKKLGKRQKALTEIEKITSNFPLIL